jgi:hypothetical protein
MGEFIGVIIFAVLVFTGAGIGIAADNTDEWVKTEDPACYLHVYEDKRLVGTDTTTRTRYCEVP